MTDLTGAKGARDAVPIVFGAAEARCFGWFHPARTPRRGQGVVLCRPLAYEANCTYETYTQLAENLATAGCDVLRFDYHGTGDSAGSDADAHRVRAWIDSTALAIHELKRLAGVSSISLFGVRLGATLAAHVASEIGGIESLVMWAPCLTGRAFARELRAASASRSGQESNLAPEDIEAFGFLYTAETLQDLNTLDCQRIDPPPAKRVMMIGRDDMPSGEGPLPSRYREMGVDITYAALPGYASMMRDPHETMIEQATLARIVDWFCAAPPSPDHSSQDALMARLPPIVNAVSENVREIPLKFGPAQSLFGILAEPSETVTPSQRSKTAILMINVGGHCHTGPSRIYVNMARSWAALGYRALRLDVSSIGDSRPESGFSDGRLGDLYSMNHTSDVRAAIDCLASRGCRNFIVLGICSGSYIAFQTAQIDPRINGQILLNSPRLEPKVDKDGARDSDTMAMPHTNKSIYFYRRRLLTPAVYLRLLRGQIDIKNIAGHFRMLITAKARRAARQLMKTAPNKDGVLAIVRRLTAQGTDTLVIVSADDPARDFAEFHFGKEGSNMRDTPNFQLVVMKGFDHTLSDLRSQKFVIDAVQRHLQKNIWPQHN